MITEFERNILQIRGVPIATVIDNMTFVDCMLFTLKGRNPDPQIAEMINGLLVAWVDHGMEPPSTANVRNAASVLSSFPSACIAGLSTFGTAHVPIELAGRFLQEMEVRSESRESQEELMYRWGRVPGIGHPVHRCDPRVKPLLNLAANNLTDLRHLGALHRAESILAGMLQEEEPPTANLAGVTAAIWLDLGFDIDTIALIPVIGRAVGWAAHYAEQRQMPAFAGSVPIPK